MNILDRPSILGNFTSAQEDIIWAIRQREEAFVFHKSKLNLNRKSGERGENYNANIKNQIMVSMVPDLVLNNINDFRPKVGRGCMLFGRVYGSQNLLDVYTQPGKGGAAQMTNVLTKYIGKIVDEIISLEGDVLKCSGNRFIAMWKCTKMSNILYPIFSAINCGLVILNSCDRFKTEAGISLRLKLCVTSGTFYFAIIGNRDQANYVLAGEVVDDMTEALQKSEIGDLMVSPTAWQFVNHKEYKSRAAEDGTHYRVFGLGPEWKYKTKSQTQLRGSILNHYEDIPTNGESDDSDSIGDIIESKRFRNDRNGTIRSGLLNAKKYSEDLAKFVPIPVQNCISANEPLSCLNEFRQLVVMSVNIIAKRSKPTITIQILNECYKLLCYKVKRFKGVVYDCTLFEKDMVVIIVFGLRGFTKVAECRECLKCATIIHSELAFVDNVQSVSISCVTGDAYCGIIGDPFRREFCIISQLLRKAHIMMVAYPHKISCDRKTFLGSRLSSSKFTLLEYKKLYGLPKQGLMYEYTDIVDMRHELSRQKERSYRPLLGREYEVELFKDLLKHHIDILKGTEKKKMKKKFKNCLIIEGQSKRGKTRLLDEYIALLKDENATNVIFTRDDLMNSYEGVRHIVFALLKLGRHTREFQRRQTINAMMKDVWDPDQLWVLNDALDVNFEYNEDFQSITSEQKDDLFEQCLQVLLAQCLTEPTFVFMDNGEYMDNDSWTSLPTILETNTVFLVIAVNRGRRKISFYNSITKNPHVEKLSLEKLSRLYHAALACQFLGVYAITAELENVIQLNSNGSPGWIENFLLTLMQAKKIYIKSIEFKEVLEQGMVTPPLYMLKRMDEEVMQNYKNLCQVTDTFVESYEQDNWNIYLDCCRENSKEIDFHNIIHSLLFDQPALPVCFAAPNFDLSHDVDAEMADDMNVLQLYDSINYREQKLWKCACVLGEPFTRTMLNYLLQIDDELEFGEAIRNMFEKNILCCARGNFLGGGDYQIMRDQILDPSIDPIVKCYCAGISIDDTCIRMPKYASCGMMRFKLERYRTVVYNILPEKELKELHITAARYFQRRTRRCASCGSYFFPEEHNCRLDDTPAGRVNRKRFFDKKIDKDQIADFSDMQDIARSKGATGDALLYKKTMKMSIMGPESSITGDLPFNMAAVETFRKTFAQDFGFISPIKIYALKNSSSLVRSFSKAQFLTCECHLILSHKYQQLVVHHKGAEQWRQMFYYALHYARVCITNKNYTAALQSIKETLALLNEKKKILGYRKWKIRLMYGKLHGFKGITLIELDLFDEAKENLYKALKYFGFSFPHKRVNLLGLLKQKWRQKLKLYFLPSTFVGKNSSITQFEITSHISEILNALCKLFMRAGDWKLAELAAIWSLTNSLQTESNLIRICDAFCNMMLIAQRQRNMFLWITLEVHSLRYCHKKSNLIEAPELRAVAKLYSIILDGRKARGEFESALHIGYIAAKLSNTSNATTTSIDIFTTLFDVLLKYQILQEVVNVMNELEYFSLEIENNTGRIWYYALCVIFQLETGYFIVPFDIVELFCNGEDVKSGTTDYNAKIRLMIVMWIWYLRNDHIEAASIFQDEIDAYRYYPIDTNKDSINTLYILEGTLLMLVYRINKRSISGMIETKKEVERLLKKLHKKASFSKFFEGRLYHLEAYFAYILNDEEKRDKYLTKAKKLSKDIDNNLELLHLDHSEKAWNREISSTVKDLWLTHCSKNPITYLDIDFDNVKIFCYTYPMPMFKY